VTLHFHFDHYLFRLEEKKERKGERFGSARARLLDLLEPVNPSYNGSKAMEEKKRKERKRRGTRTRLN